MDVQSDLPEFKSLLRRLGLLLRLRDQLPKLVPPDRFDGDLLFWRCGFFLPERGGRGSEQRLDESLEL